MKTPVFWDVAPCSLVEIDQHFGGACFLHHKDDESVSFYQTTWCNIPEDGHLHVCPSFGIVLSKVSIETTCPTHWEH
jgi:hypothetical protein